jgi:hypothetical protein
MNLGPTSRSSGRTCRTEKKKRHNQGEEAFGFWCRALKLPTPQRNFRFHPTRKFEIDWAWPQYLIGVEIQGGIWVGGAHARPMNIVRDMTKHNLLLDFGWRVWHFTPKEVIDGIAVQHIDKVLRAAHPSLDQTLTTEAVIPPSEERYEGQTSLELELQRPGVGAGLDAF